MMSGVPAPAVVLFDLDGTLSDSAPGILAALRSALAAHGVGPLTAEQERELLGPPFAESLPPLVGADQMESFIAAYRDHYGAGGMFDTVPYPGVPDLVAALAERGVRMAVATSQPEHYAVPIVDHLSLPASFETICGDTLDGLRSSKALVVGEALSRLGDPAPESVLMVGDRVHDVRGAAAHGIVTAGAGWGYGTPAELAGAVATFDTADDLRLALIALLDSRPC